MLKIVIILNSWQVLEYESCLLGNQNLRLQILPLYLPFFSASIFKSNVKPCLAKMEFNEDCLQVKSIQLSLLKVINAVSTYRMNSLYYQTLGA
jgi:hypothetical protein